MNLMLIDDDRDLARLLEDVLEADGIWVVPFDDPAEAISSLENGAWLAAMVSLDLPDDQGLAYLEAVSLMEGESPPVILISSKLREWDDAVEEARELADGGLFLRKPLPLLDLNDMLRDLRAGVRDAGDFGGLGTAPSISVDLDGGHQVEFSPASEASTNVEPKSGGGRSARGALAGLARGRESDSLLDVDPLDLEPLDVSEEDLVVMEVVTPSFDLEIEDDESEEDAPRASLR